MRLEAGSHQNAYKYIAAIIYAVVLFLDRLDLTIVNITLPTLAKYYNAPITQTEWITNAFLFALAISIPISNWLGDRFGDKKVFILSVFAFGLTSMLCAYAPTLTSMIIYRFLQGIGGGIIIPVGMGMVYKMFNRSEYASITSYIFLPTLVAPAISPFLGGLIIQLSNWQWVFLFSVPICLLAVIFSLLFMKGSSPIESKPFDTLGFISGSMTLMMTLYAISSLGKYSLSFNVLMLFGISFTLATLFYNHEKRTPNPLFDIHFFKNRIFLQANIVQLFFQMCHFGSIFLIGMYLQVGLGMNVMLTGLIMGSQAVGAMTTSRISVRLFNLYGAGLPILIGFSGIFTLTACILLVNSPEKVLLGALILFARGIFSGLCGTPIQAASIIGFDHKEVGRASALFNAGRQIAISLGVSISSVFIAYGYHKNGLNITDSHSLVGASTFYPAFVVQGIIAGFGFIYAMRIENSMILSNIKQSS